MKTFLLVTRVKALLVFIGVLSAVATGHPSYGSDASDMAFEFGNPAFTDMSPVPRGLLSSDDVASGRLSKRQCAGGQLYCPATSFCCNPGYSCCSNTFCCATGFACPLTGPCVPAAVLTVTYTTTNFVTSSTLSYVTSISTALVVLTSTGYTTITTHVHSGVSTSTVWATVTTTQVMKRDAVAAPTPAMTETHDLQTFAPKPSMESSLVEGQTPIAELLRRALGGVGLLEKRQVVTSYQTVVFTSTIYSYSYSTINNVVTSSSNAVVQATFTSTIVDSASSTITVVSTITATVISSNNHAITTTISTGPGESPASPATSPASPTTTTSRSSSVSPVPASSTSPTISGTSGGLSQGAKIGIGVGASLGALLVAAVVGACLWHRRRSTADGGASNRDTMLSQPEVVSPAPAGAGAAMAAGGIEGEKVPVSPMSSTVTDPVPSPPPMHQAYWSPQQAYEMPQQTYRPHELPQQSYQPYESPQQTYQPYQPPQQTYQPYEMPEGHIIHAGDQINHG